MNWFSALLLYMLNVEEKTNKQWTRRKPCISFQNVLIFKNPHSHIHGFIHTRLHTYTTLPVLLHVYSYKPCYHGNAVHMTFCSPTRDTVLSNRKTEKLVIFPLEAKYDHEIVDWSFLKEQRICFVKLFLFHDCIRRVIKL